MIEINEPRRRWYQNGHRNKQAKVTWEIVDEIRAKYTDKRKRTGPGVHKDFSYATLGSMYNLNPSTVGDILKGKSWREEFRPKTT